MTSKFSIDNRELLQRISSGEAVVGIDFGNLIVRELAAFRLAAMGSEPDCKERKLFCSTDTARMKKVISVSAGSDDAPLYRHAQPVPVVSADLLHTAASAIEDLLTNKDRTGSGVWFDLPFRLRSAANEQTAPVVPDDVLDALQKVARIRLDLNDFDGDRRGIADCLCDAEEALIEVVNRRAAMLAAAPQLPGSEPATVPGKWIPVSERMPEEDTDVIVYCSDTEEQFVAYHNCNGYFHYATYEKKGEGYVDIVCNPTHWQPLPEPPQEVKP